MSELDQHHAGELARLDLDLALAHREVARLNEQLGRVLPVYNAAVFWRENEHRTPGIARMKLLTAIDDALTPATDDAPKVVVDPTFDELPCGGRR